MEARNRDFRPAQFWTMLIISSQAISSRKESEWSRLTELAVSLEKELIQIESMLQENLEKCAS